MTKHLLEKKYPVEWLNPTTEKAIKYNANYQLTTKGNSIFTAYGRPSQKKINAFGRCEQLMKDLKGTNMRVTGAGSHFFSCAFKFNFKGGSLLCYITPSHNWITKLENYNQ